MRKLGVKLRDLRNGSLESNEGDDHHDNDNENDDSVQELGGAPNLDLQDPVKKREVSLRAGERTALR